MKCSIPGSAKLLHTKGEDTMANTYRLYLMSKAFEEGVFAGVASNNWEYLWSDNEYARRLCIKCGVTAYKAAWLRACINGIQKGRNVGNMHVENPYCMERIKAEN